MATHRREHAPSPSAPMSDRQGTCLPIIWWHHQDNDEKPLPEHEVCWWLVWDGGDAHMEVQLYRDGTVDWFACDRSKMSGSSPTGSEDAEPAAKVFADPAFSAGMVAVKDGYDAAVSAEVTALRADLAKREAMREICNEPGGET